MDKTAQEINVEEQNQYILIHERKDRDGCFTANGLLICRCGKCKLEDYNLPNDLTKNK